MLTNQTPDARAAGDGGSGSGGGGSEGTVGTIVYPYAVPAALFPLPANLSGSAPALAVAAIPFPGAVSSYAVVNVSGSSGPASSATSVWFEVASYSPTAAREIAKSGTCGVGCGDLPFVWSNQSEVAVCPEAISALHIAAIGSSLVVGETCEGWTYLYSWSETADSWGEFGPAIDGQLTAMATDPEEVGVVTLTAAGAEVTTVDSTGATVGAASITPGAGGTGIFSAAIAMVPRGPVFAEDVIVSVNGTNELDLTTSTDGSTFSTPTSVATFSPAPKATGDATVGQTMLLSLGGVAGQVALVAAGPDLTLLYTTFSSGQVVPVTEGLNATGTSLTGPYVSGPVNGSVEDPGLTVGPDGLVYGAWDDPDFGSGVVEEATYEPDGLPVTSPEPVAGGVSSGTVPEGAPAVAVDAFARPLVLWPVDVPSSPGAIGYTGGYLSPAASLNRTTALLGQSLGAADFSRPADSPATVSSFVANATSEAASILGSVSSGELCDAQNATAFGVYANLTHVPLTVAAGSGSVCASTLDPRGSVSPLLSSSGIEAPNTYYAVYVDWVLESEGVPVSTSPLSSVTGFAPYEATVPIATLPKMANATDTASGEIETIHITPTPYSPTAYELTSTSSIPTTDSTVEGTSCDPPNPGPRDSTTYSTAVSTWTNVSVDGGHTTLYTTSGPYPSVWVYNLTAGRTYSWSETLKAKTVETVMSHDPCTGGSSSTHATTRFAAETVSGSFSTSLSVDPGKSFVTAAFNGGKTAAKLTVQFNSTLPSTGEGSLSNGTGSQSWSTTTDAIAGAYALTEASGADEAYSLTVTSTSRAGTGVAPGSPSLAYGLEGDADAERASASCAFTLSPTSPTISFPTVDGVADPYTSLNASTVNVTWYSTADDLGFFSYHEVASALNWTVTGIAPVAGSGGSWVYTMELHGLEPMVNYSATVGVSWNRGCLVEEDQAESEFRTGTDPVFTTDATLPTVWESDLPYDSVNRTGGGLTIGWDTPKAKTLGQGVHTLEGGYVELKGGAGDTHYAKFTPSQVEFLPVGSNGNNSTSNVVNLTTELPGLGLNEVYHYTVVANYTFEQKKHGSWTAATESATGKNLFTYQADTTDDGLTDREKDNGWVVPLAPSATFDGTVVPACRGAEPNTTIATACADDPAAWVTADPADYATNGLVGDFVEKQFDLNPKTIDTAGSHMLDTWNLTFNLGTENVSSTMSTIASLGTDYIQVYYENTTYVFNKVCQSYSPGQGSCSFAPLGGSSGWSNLTTAQACPKSGLVCHTKHWLGDSNPIASRVLWSLASLASLEGLIRQEGAVWLRGVIGNYRGDQTLTVWGKLSWGANPLTSSTSHDGLADGDQVDPMGPVSVLFNLTAWQEGNIPSPRGSYGGTGAAPYLTVESANGSSLYYAGFGPCSGIGDGVCGRSSESELSNATANWNQVRWGGARWGNSYQVTVPVVSSSQYVHWDLQIFANDSTSGPATPISRVSPVASWSSSPMTANIASLGARTAVASPLWSKSEGSTPSGGVWLNYSAVPGRPRASTYLIVPAGTTPLSSEPWGLKRYVGETDFDLLVLNLNTSGPLTLSGIENAGGTATTQVTLRHGLNNVLVPRGAFLYSPLAQAVLNGVNDTIEATPGTGLVYDATYWWIRSHEDGYVFPWSSDRVRVDAPENESIRDSALNLSDREDFGGGPTNPGLESGNESREVQAVVWVNISDSWELQNLLGGLLLNSSGGVANNIVNVTYEVGTLDLPVAVVTMMANSSERSNGSYSAPEYNPQYAVSSSQWQQFLSAVWNTLSGVGSYIVNSVRAIAEVGWSAGVAAQAYVAGLATRSVETVSHGLEAVVAQTDAVLSAVGRAMLWAMEALLDSAFSPMLSAIDREMEGYVHGLWADWTTLWGQENTSGAVSGSSATAFLNQTLSGPFVVALEITTAIAVALTIIQALSVGIGFIADSLVEFVAGAIGSAALIYRPSDLPSDLLSEGAVSLASSELNTSLTNDTSISGGQGSPDVPPATPSLSLTTFFSTLVTVVGFGISSYGLWHDAPAAVDTVELAESTDVLSLDSVTLEPVVSAALGVLSLALATDALGFAGSVRALLDGVGFVLGLLSAVYAAWCVYSPTSRTLLQAALQLDDAYVGLGFDIGGAVDAAAQLALDYA